MIRFVWILVALLGLHCQDAGLSRPANLSYEVRIDPGRRFIGVTGRVDGLPSGEYFFVLPRTQGLSPDRFIRDMRFAEGDRMLDAELTELNEWRVRTTGGGVSFSYRIDANQPIQYQDEAWGGAISQIEDGMAFLAGTMSFVIPLVDPIRQPITLRWDVPAGWHIVTPWSVDRQETSIPSHYGLVRNYYVAFARGSILQRRVGTMDVTVVWLGEDDIQRYTEAENAMQRVIGAAQSFIGSPVGGESLTLILRGSNAGNRFRASTESNSIEFNFKKGITFERLWRDHRDGFLRLLAHEIMHTWDRREVKRASEYLNVREWGPDTCWLREGFTEYFANLNLYRAGVHDRDRFVNTMQALSTTAHDIARETPRSLLEACGPFWNDRSSMQFVYTEGASLAFVMDMELRRATGGEKSLPALMRRFMEEYRYREKTVEAFGMLWVSYAPEELHAMAGLPASRQAVNLGRRLEALGVVRKPGSGARPARWDAPGTSAFSRYFRP